MIKNLILTLISIIGIGTSTALSQQITGSWEAIASYGGIPTRMIETSDKVYTLSQGNLSSYDKKSGEIYYYNKSNILNGDRIANIFYNYDRDYLLISYDDDNIDVLTDDRRVINFPEIMNASLTSAKTINNVAFSGPRAYLATGYGLTVLNVDKGIVEQSGIYDFPIAAVAVTSDRVFVCITTGSTGTPGTWSAPLTSSLNRFESFTKALNDQVMNLEALSDNTILGIGNSMVKLTYNAETDKITMQVIRGGFNKTKLQRTRDGFFAHDSGSKFVMFLDKDGENRREVTLPAAVAGNAVSCYAGDESKLWVGNSEGYGLYDVTTGQFTINRMKPEGTSGPNVGLIKSAADGSIYFMTMSDSNINTASYINNVFVDKLSPDGTYSEVSPVPAVTRGYKLSVTPFDSDIYALAHRKFITRYNTKDNTYKKYDASNSNLAPGITLMPVDLRFDKNGNLWILLHWDEDGVDNLYFISREEWARGGDTMKMTPLDFGTYETSHTAAILPHSSGIVLFSGKEFIGAYDTRNTPEDPSDDRYVIIDQTGTDDYDMTLNGWVVTDMEEDENGRVWLTTNGGVRLINDPRKMFESGWRINRPRVPRNDGTNLADFLLDNEEVMDVDIDANNHKWFATNGSGLYHVNPDGTEILEYFNTDNSDIISNNVYAVHADRNSNDIYVGTNIGACIYHSTSGPAADDYSDVYAYPNPVTPDYTGMITITGLMDKSLVKIADSAGNVFYQTISDGGMVMWDGCDSSGSRVKSGVYFVIASQNSSGSSSVVTKILVIN